MILFPRLAAYTTDTVTTATTVVEDVAKITVEEPREATYIRAGRRGPKRVIHIR